MNRLLATAATTLLMMLSLAHTASAGDAELNDVRDRLKETMPGLEITSM